MTLAAIAFVVLIAALGLFQLLLVAGAPFGRLAWGGQHVVLPKSFRIGSAIAIGLYAVFAIVVLDAARLIAVVPTTWSDDLIWALAAYFVIGIAVNALSRSRPERFVMTPLAFALAALCTIVGLGQLNAAA